LFAACLGVASAVCFVVAYLNRHPDTEGAYFTRKIGGSGSPYAGIETTFNPFDPWDGYLWLGAGIALVLVALAVLILGRFARPA
jgi:hypothetical protein